MSGGHAKWLCSPAVAPCCSLHLFKHNRRATLPPPTSAAGTSALTALTELFSLIRLHTCLTRIWNMMMPRPGGRQNGQGPCMSYVLPGCGGVALAEIGVAHLVLVVSPPPSSGDVLSAAPVPPLRITMRWVGRYADDAPQATVALTASSNGNTTPQQQKQKQQQQQQQQQQRTRRRDELVCSLSSEPPLPATITAVLAARLDEGNERAFLDGCCTAGHTAAAVQAHLLSSEAQRSAGLLPGALMLEDIADQPDVPPRAVGQQHSGSGVAQQPAPAYALCCRLQQDGRALRLRLQFAEAGYVLMRLMPLAALATATLPPWLNALWERLLQLPGTKAVQVAGGAGGGGKNSRTAWVNWETLSGALSAVLLAVAVE